MSSETRIKVESSNELQTYLDSLNKEMDIADDNRKNNVTKEIESEEEEEGTYFVDQAGNYYYQATKNSEPLLANITDDNDEDNENVKDTIDDNDECKEEDVIEENTVRTRSQRKAVRESAKKNVKSKKMKTGDDEVSYLFIMDDNSKQDDDDNDNENEKHDANEVYEFETDDPSIKEESGTQKVKKIKEMIRGNQKNKQDNSNMHVCGYCDYSSSKRYLLARHMKSHSEERPFKCSICERGFKTQASLQNHVNTHTGIKPHQCSYCFSSFTTSGELVRHVRYRHTHEKPHKCTECDYASVELSKLKRHIRCHTGERPYQCPHCTYASPDTFKLKRHLRIHTGEKPYECDICHARFTQSNSLKAHKLIHSVGDKPVFQCELCPTTCGRKTDLRIHVQKLHTSDQPLKCRRCNKLFPDRYSYKVHSKTHDGEKCFKCELCPYASISARHLESHMLIHTDQKPYECSLCDQSFRQKQLLKRHNNLYHNKNYVPPQPKPKTHVCPDCERSFSHKGNLIRHMAIHDPESGAKEVAYALKLGRQKKVHILNNDESMEFVQDSTTNEEQFVIPDNSKDGDDDQIDTDTIVGTVTVKEENKHIVALQTDDNQQYVVLEVIQVDGETTTAHINEIDNNDDNQITDDDYIFADLSAEVPESKGFKEEVLDETTDSKDQMEVCFGFDVN